MLEIVKSLLQTLVRLYRNTWAKPLRLQSLRISVQRFLPSYTQSVVVNSLLLQSLLKHRIVGEVSYA